MTWTAPEITRIEAPFVSDERTSLQAWLDYHRQTLLWKCGGLTAEQLCQRPVTTSTLSLLGLVRHLGEVERWWFRRNAAAEPIGDMFCSEEYFDGDFDLVDAADAEADFAAVQAEFILADKAVEDMSLDDTYHFVRDGKVMDLRWTYTHMIEEYARHNGHADLLREMIDGRTGL